MPMEKSVRVSLTSPGKDVREANVKGRVGAGSKHLSDLAGNIFWFGVIVA